MNLIALEEDELHDLPQLAARLGFVEELAETECYHEVRAYGTDELAMARWNGFLLLVNGVLAEELVRGSVPDFLTAKRILVGYVYKEWAGFALYEQGTLVRSFRNFESLQGPDEGGPFQSGEPLEWETECAYGPAYYERRGEDFDKNREFSGEFDCEIATFRLLEEPIGAQYDLCDNGFFELPFRVFVEDKTQEQRWSDPRQRKSPTGS